MPLPFSARCTARFAACLALAMPAALAANAQRLVIVASGDEAPYQQMIAGMRKLGATIETVPLQSDASLAFALARGGKDTAIVALGAAAAASLAGAAPVAPVVNCTLEIPFDAQILWMKRLLPNARNIGLLFDPAQNERRAADDAAALARAGYTPLLEPVSGPTALPNALNRLSNRVDVLQALPDTTVFAREHSRALLLFSFRHQIPLTGPGEAWVKAGALDAVDWDYPDVGRYCASLALRAIAGGKAQMPAPPRTRVVANIRSAEQLGIKWDAETLRSLDKLYESR